jgi:citrate synthase
MASVTRSRETTARTVADLMTTPAVVADPTETVRIAAKRMSEHGVGSVVVLSDGAVVGILTERDLVRMGGAGADPSTATVGEWMTAAPDCVGPDVEVVDAWRQFAEHGYRHIPVVAGGGVKGVVSIRDLVSVSHLRPVDGLYTDVPRGLEGVVAAETAVGSVRGTEGFFHYRQYDATELARFRSLEDVWELLFDGSLPDAGASTRFAEEAASYRQPPQALMELLPALANAATTASTLDQLRTAVSLLGSIEGMRPTRDLTAAEARIDALKISAAMPVLAAALHRHARSLEPVAPDPELSMAENYLYMLTGDRPDPVHVRAVERYLVLTIDHGLNASTFTTRVITSTGADVAAAVVGGICALSGPLHGGAPSRALDTLDAIGSPERAEAFIRAAIESGDRIMGFGHRVYRTLDPRSELMKETARELGGPLPAFAEQVEATVVALLAELKPNRQLYTNVEFYAGVVMELCGISREMFTPTFALSRAVGWCAHLLEQAADNRIIRPSSRYVGPPAPQRVPRPD